MLPVSVKLSDSLMTRLRVTVSDVEFLRATVCCSDLPTSTEKKLINDLSDSTGNTVGNVGVGADWELGSECWGFCNTPNERPGLLVAALKLLTICLVTCRVTQCLGPLGLTWSIRECVELVVCCLDRVTGKLLLVLGGTITLDLEIVNIESSLSM